MSSLRDDGDWVRAIALDDREGETARRDLRVLVVASLRRVLGKRGVGPELAEDLAQESLLRVRANLSSYRREARFTTWALSIATRLAFDELRHKRWKDVSLESLTAGDGPGVQFEGGGDDSPERSMARERVLRVLSTVIAEQLTDKQRTVLSAELEGMPHAEIAAQLGMNRNALYKLAHDARKRVKSELASAGIVEADVLWVFE